MSILQKLVFKKCEDLGALANLSPTERETLRAVVDFSLRSNSAERLPLKATKTTYGTVLHRLKIKLCLKGLSTQALLKYILSQVTDEDYLQARSFKP